MRIITVLASIAAVASAVAVKKNNDVCGWGTSEAWGCALRIRAPSNTFNNLYLTVRDNGTLYLNNEDARLGTSRTDPTYFFAGLYDKTGTLSLLPDINSSPVTPAKRKRDIIPSLQLGLQQQSPGFLTLINYMQPTYMQADAGAGASSLDKPTEWAVFTVDPRNGKVGVEDGTNLPSRTWAAYSDADSNHYIGLWDGVTTLPYQPINITITAYERYRHWDTYRGWVDDGLYPVGSRNKGFL